MLGENAAEGIKEDQEQEQSPQQRAHGAEDRQDQSSQGLMGPSLRRWQLLPGPLNICRSPNKSSIVLFKSVAVSSVRILESSSSIIFADLGEIGKYPFHILSAISDFVSNSMEQLRNSHKNLGAKSQRNCLMRDIGSR